MKTLSSLTFLLALGTMSTIGAAAQGPAARVGGGAAYEYYEFSDEAGVGMKSITLLTAPFAARGSLGNRVRLTAAGAFARAMLTAADGTESTLEGLTDTRFSVEVDLIPQGLTLAGMVIAPTGESNQTSDEAIVAGIVSADLLPFRISNWGSGGGFGAQLRGTRDFGAIGAGFSVAYRRAEDFEPLVGNDLVYRPGSELQARVALDADVGAGAKWSLLLGFQDFAEDLADGSNIFQSGRRYEATTTLAFPTGYRGSGAVFGGVLHRENGQFFGAPLPEAPTQDLIWFGALLRRPALGGWFIPRADVRAFRSEDGMGQGYVAGLGFQLELETALATWIPSARGRYGNVEVAEGSESSLFGFEVGLTVRLGR